MGEKMRNDCDVFGTFNDVKKMGVILMVEEVVVFEASIDAGPRARGRAERLIRKALSPPTRKAKA